MDRIFPRSMYINNMYKSLKEQNYSFNVFKRINRIVINVFKSNKKINNLVTLISKIDINRCCKSVAKTDSYFYFKEIILFKFSNLEEKFCWHSYRRIVSS